MNLESTSNTVVAPTFSDDSRKRGILLLVLFVFPLVLSSLVFLLVMLISDIDFAPIGAESQYAQIKSPTHRSAVPKTFTLSGSVNTPLDQHAYYLIEYRDNHYWPKFDLGNKAQSWQKTLTLRAKKNHYATYQVIMANSVLKKEIDTWFKTARDTGKYPGIAHLDIEHVVANIKVKTL